MCTLSCIFIKFPICCIKTANLGKFAVKVNFTGTVNRILLKMDAMNDKWYPGSKSPSTLKSSITKHMLGTQHVLKKRSNLQQFIHICSGHHGYHWYRLVSSSWCKSICHTLKTCTKKLGSHQKAAVSFWAALLNNSRHQNHSLTPNANFGLVDFSEKIFLGQNV
jgi:hypothetical protein